MPDPNFVASGNGSSRYSDLSQDRKCCREGWLPRLQFVLIDQATLLALEVLLSVLVVHPWAGPRR